MVIFLLTTSLQGVSLMKPHRDLGITRQSAWSLAHRPREAWTEVEAATFGSQVEADETSFGGKCRKMSNAKRKALADTGRGAVDRTAVADLCRSGSLNVPGAEPSTWDSPLSASRGPGYPPGQEAADFTEARLPR